MEEVLQSGLLQGKIPRKKVRVLPKGVSGEMSGTVLHDCATIVDMLLQTVDYYRSMVPHSSPLHGVHVADQLLC